MRFVMDLRSCFDQILEMCASEEVPEVDEFAVVLVFNIDDAPAVGTATHLATINGDVLLRPNNGEGHETLSIC